MKKKIILTNFIWRFAERCSAQLVSSIVAILLARILIPEDYGTIALVTVFTTILEQFVYCGLGTALVQKKDADDLDFSSAFYFNIIMCMLIYTGMFIVAPFIAAFYENTSLTPIIRVLSLTIVISGVRDTLQAYVSRNMLFKRFFFSTIGGTVFSAFLGIGLAYAGYGVWALVAQQLSNMVIDALILWITVKWRPKKMFSWKRLKTLLRFGSRILASSLLDTVYANIQSLVIGKMYSSADLAYYNQGDKFPNLIINNVNTSIDSVLLPAMACEQDDHIRVKNMTRRSIKISTYIMAPLMMGMFICAGSIIKIFLKEKWLPCVPYMRIFCITYMFYPINTANLNAIKAMGHSDLCLKMQVIKKIVGFILLGYTIKYGVKAMAYSFLISSLINTIINAWPNRTLLRYSFAEQLKDIFSEITLAILMGILVSFIGWLPLPALWTLVLQLLFGGIIYIGLSVLFKLDSFEYLWKMAKEWFGHNL